MLNVGDVVVAMSGYGRTSYRFITIERVTRTQAVSGHYRFKRQTKNWWGKGGSFGVDAIGDGMWSRTSYELATPKHREDADIAERRQRCESIIRGTRFSDLPLEVLESIVALIPSKADPEP